MTKGCKIWLGILFVGAIINTLAGFTVISYSAGMGVFSLVIGVGQIASIAALLFKQKKEGFYAYCLIIVINCIYNGVFLYGELYNTPLPVNLLAAVLSLSINIGITVFFLNRKKSGEELDVFPHPNSTNFYNTMNNYTAAAGNPNSAPTSEASAATSGSTHTSQTNSSSEKAGNGKTTDSFAGNKTSFFGSSKTMEVTVDFYKELDIDRAWDEKTIRNHLKNLYRIWIQRQGATNDKEQLLIIDSLLKNVENAMRYLTKAAKRQVYDKSLELAYQAGKLVDDAEEKLHTILDQARAYYRKGNIKLAAQFAEEAVTGEVNDVSAYDLLARCYFDMNVYDKALGVVDQGLSIFKTDINLHWLGARIATIGAKNFENAQQRINRLIELAPENSIGHSEQVYLHLRSGNEQLAFQEIDSYVKAHPDDDNFKRGVAYDLDTYSNICYYYDAAQNATFIADKAAYQKCLALRTKAVEIFADEHTQNQLENAKYYGKKEWNDWNMPAIKSLATYGTIFTVLGFIAEAFLPLGITLYIIMGILIYFSFRPYWQINKSYVTGQAGTLEKIISRMGDAAARMAEISLRVLIQTMSLIFKFIIGLASGRWF